MKPLTDKQLKLLRLCDDHGEYHGSAEIECQWGGYELDNDPDGVRELHLTHMVIQTLARSLIKRGLVVPSESCSGWTVTEAGRRVLEQRAEK